ncbi:MAG: pentapeptide repeat-containing protein [Candidatus Eremiobacteraeota bacterium]|nr:pentapeptide repeat-containing protein [Candidatus Eremiobacteraeota bacterium]
MMGLPQGFVTVASVLSAIVLNALWQDALLVVSIWALLRLWPRINAATRYVVWSATLIAAFVIPVATTLALFAAPQPAPVPVVTTQTTQTTRTTQAMHMRPTFAPVHTATSATVPAAPRMPERLRLTMPAPVSVAVFVVWFLLAAYALFRLIIGLVSLERLKRDALPLSVEYRDAMPQWTRANKGARDVRLCVSDETDVPVAVGLFDAMILVPHTLLDSLSEGEVDQICLHELAHLRRADDWTNGFQRVLIALLGWNPAAQFIGQQLDLEREVACDDWALSFVGMIRPYALCLTKMAERASWPRHPIPAPGVFATRKHISLRIERLLGAGRNIATNLSLAPAAVAIAAVVALALAISVVAPSVAAPSVAQKVASPTIARTAPPPKVVPMRTIVREVRVAVASTPAAASVTVPSVTVPSVTVPSVKVPAVTVSGVHVPKVVIPKITVPYYNSKQLAETISKQVRENIDGALGRPAAAGSAQNCSGCDFGSVNWSGRDMRGVNYTGVDLSRANLTGTNFSGGSFNGVDFRKANLSGASFRDARLTGCDFSEANLSGVDFRGGRLSGCQFTGAQLASSELRDVLNSCTGCDFRRASLAGLNLSNVRANGDDFSGADLRGVNFAGAVLVGIDFSNAHLDGANFDGTTFNGCDLEHVDLSHVDLSRAKMIGMDFSNRRTPPAPPPPP